MATVNLPLVAVDNHPDEKLVNETLEALVNKKTSPKDAAQKIDSIIIGDLKRAATDSRPLGWEHYLWDSIGRSAMVIPAEHPGQEYLVTFLQDIQQLPKTTIPYRENEKGHEKVFWSLNAANGYSGLAQWLWELKEGEERLSSGILLQALTHCKQGGFARHERPNEDSSYLRQNFAAFLAKLLAAGMVEATRLSGLIRPSLFATTGPSSSNAHQYEEALLDAAQWIFYAGDALYEMCEKETLIEIPGPKWTPAVWASWKAKFDQAGQAEFLGEEGRRVAQKALKHIGETEKRGVTTNICETFGFTSIKDDDE
jgi:hypothetical protein